MQVLNKSHYGAINISKQVMNKLVLDELLKYEDIVFPCSHTGKPLKKGFFSGINELLSSIEIHEAANGTYIFFYIIVKFGESINEICNAIFDSIERDFEMFSLVKPVEIKACVKGVQAEHLTRRDFEVIRTNK
ncbi:Asp23/Gls24 family envelope stress response protein [Mogibacterium diversum]|uniref:Asp23/Gls24 family envelope stress response protein n=1 Tax=Mogibacterium diversum TaxID=114527 RepID=UPI0028D5536D|nr:Asp23/Gls24 family envelope stress response protein [Mogibacterium diversum]